MLSCADLALLGCLQKVREQTLIHRNCSAPRASRNAAGPVQPAIGAGHVRSAVPAALSAVVEGVGEAGDVGNGLGKPGLCVEGNLHVGEEALMEAPDAVRDASALLDSIDH